MSVALHRRWKSTAITGFLVLCAALLMWMYNASDGVRPSLSNGLPGNAPPVASGVEKIKLASGVARALFVDLPLLGRVRGDRWLSNQRFEAPAPVDQPSRSPVSRPYDVLLDDHGNFIAARLNGESYFTRPPGESFHAIFIHLMTVAAGGQPPATPHRVVKIERPAIPRDDPELSRILKHTSDPVYTTLRDNWETGVEEIITVLDVWVEGEATPRRFTVRRHTDGRVREALGAEPGDTSPTANRPVPGANRYGTWVATTVALVENGELRAVATMNLTEPWNGPSPLA